MYTLTTVGYGDVSAQNVYEKLVAMAAMMVGVTVFAYFMGNTASFIAAVNSQEAAISQRVMQVGAIQETASPVQRGGGGGGCMLAP